MQRLASKISRAIANSIVKFSTKTPSSLPPVRRGFTTYLPSRRNDEILRREAIPGDFLKWGSLGFVRTSGFATGFNPLQRKPLDSIMDLERAKNRSPEDLVSIWDDMPHMLFTGLEDYKARGTQAAPYFTVTYYTEFEESKDLVLIRGDVVFTSKLADEEAKWLVETMQSVYLNDTRYKLVERFNKQTRDFEFKDVLQALDMPVL